MPPKEPPRPSYRERQESNPLSGLWPRSSSPSDMLDAQRAQAGQIVANLTAGGENARRLGAVEFRLDKVEAAVSEVAKSAADIKHSVELHQAITEEAETVKAQGQQRTLYMIGLLCTVVSVLANIAFKFL